MKHIDHVLTQLKDCVETLDLATRNVKSFYEMRVTDENGHRTVLETREKYLELLINVVSENLSFLIEEIEERESVKSNLKLIK